MNNIRKLRKQANMTQSRLGELLGVQDAAVSKYESGKIPLTDDSLRKLAQIFHVSTDYILNIDSHTNEYLDAKFLYSTKNDDNLRKNLKEIIHWLSITQKYAQLLEDLDEEDKELLIASIENTTRLAKKLAKQKFHSL